MMDITSEDRALLILNDKTIHGLTRLRLYGFLLSRQYEWELNEIAKCLPELKFYSDWEPSWGGPHSASLQANIKACMINGKVAKTPSVYETDMMDEYGLTFKGRAVWRRIFSRSNDEIDGIGKKIGKLQKVSFETLLCSVYGTYPEYCGRCKTTSVQKQV